MNQPTPTYTREQLVAFLAAWMKTHPGLTLAAAREEGRQRGFTVGRREYEEARLIGTGSALHPEHGGIVDRAEAARAAEALRATEEANAAAAERMARESASHDASELAVPAPAAERSASESAADDDSDELGAAAPSAPSASARMGTTAARPTTAAASDLDAARAFWTDFLRRRPEASFRELNAASVAAGHRPATPIGFGMARKAAGIARAVVRLKPSGTGPARAAVAGAADDDGDADDAPEIETPPSRRSSSPRRSETAASGFEGGALDDVRRLMADYERLREALIEIARIVRSARAD
jgi:hypothetical protein